ncbi:hypothetical protein ON010_g1099 [Phytophthora cinnamomi]|nr:hypothetical protein ON010_g1099 [Phytophthora cinnamomi]
MQLTAITRWNPFAPPPPPPESTSLLGRMQDIATHELESSRALLSDFQDFIQQGNMLDMAVGLMLGARFSAILNSFVVDIVSPITSLLSGTVSDLEQPTRTQLGAPTRPGRLGSKVTTTSQAVTRKSVVLTAPLGLVARDAGAVTINYGLFAENVMVFPYQCYLPLFCGQER